MNTTTRSHDAHAASSRLLAAGAILVAGAIALALSLGSDSTVGPSEQDDVDRVTEPGERGPEQADPPVADVALGERTQLVEGQVGVDFVGAQNAGVASEVAPDAASWAPDVSYYEEKYAGQTALELSEYLAALGNEIGSLSFNHARAAAADGRGKRVEGLTLALDTPATNDSFEMIASFDGGTFVTTLTREEYPSMFALMDERAWVAEEAAKRVKEEDE